MHNELEVSLEIEERIDLTGSLNGCFKFIRRHYLSMKSKTQRYTDGLPFACTRSKKLIWKLKKLISNNDKVVFEFYKIKSIFTFCFLQYLIITLESLYTLKYGVFCSTEQNSLFFMRTMLKCQYIGRLTCLVVYDPLFHRDKISSTSTTQTCPNISPFPDDTQQCA